MEITPNKTTNLTASSVENYSWFPSTDSIEQSPSSCENHLNKSLDSVTTGRRGRPKSEILSALMMQGSTSPSAIKCKFCNRVFPRDKSLSAHLRTHTGERPYICDFPLCSRAFTQSGQLKTHQRLHTGERPFSCGKLNCQMRFTHANRHCPDHPYEALKRNDDDLVFNAQPEEQSIEILKWLQKYREERQQFLLQQIQSPSTTTRKTPKRPSSTSSSVRGNEENKRRIFGKSLNEEDHNCDTDRNMPSPKTTVRSKGFMCEMDLNVQSSTPVHHQSQDGSDISSVMASPISTNKQKYCRPKIILWKEPIDANDDDELVINNDNELKDHKSSCNNTVVSNNSNISSPSSPVKKMLNPKKKWLRQSEAWQEQDLARPLDYGINHPLYHSERNWQMTSNSECSSTSPSLLNPNQSRPSVLIMAKDKFE